MKTPKLSPFCKSVNKLYGIQCVWKRNVNDNNCWISCFVLWCIADIWMISRGYIAHISDAMQQWFNDILELPFHILPIYRSCKILLQRYIIQHVTDSLRYITIAITIIISLSERCIITRYHSSEILPQRFILGYFKESFCSTNQSNR